MKTIKLMSCLLSALFAVSALAEVVVIVNPKNPVTALTADQATGIFLAKSNEFPSGGGAAVPIDQSEGTALRDEFYQKSSNRDSAQIKAYWSKIVFTGKGQPPKAVSNSAEVKKLVAANPNMIGYVDKASVDASVKAVLSLP
jgi:ABC-type phosphate transport system substrate-binding protein